MRTAALAVVLAAACTPSTELDDPTLGEASRIAESSPEAFGVLDLLHDGSTTLSVLDDEVPLDARAARSLIAHRDGPDETFGTADDDRFDTIAEVDDQYYVGAAALDALAAYAEARGHVPVGDALVLLPAISWSFSTLAREGSVSGSGVSLRLSAVWIRSADDD